MGRQSQRKGAEGEKELAQHLLRAGYPVRWGGNKTYGTVPDVSGLAGIHIECKRVEQLNIARAVAQAAADASRFQDGAPTVFHRRNNSPWLVTMQLPDWLRLYGAALDHDSNARAFFLSPQKPNIDKGEEAMNFWETEKPRVVNTGRNVLEYFPTAQRLSIAKPNWINAAGEEKRGKTVMLDLQAVKDCPEAANIFREIVGNL